MGTPVMNEIVRKINLLPDNLQRQVLSYVDALQTNFGENFSGKALLEFAGAISAEDLEMMTEAIESGCEQVDGSEW